MPATKARPRPRHVPQRTCVSCRSTTGKRELVRLVRTAEGAVEVDPTGKRPGRGAYLCQRGECWQQGVRKGRLEQALKTRIPPAQREALFAYAVERQLIETE